MTVCPGTPSEAVDEWKAKKATGRHDQSSLMLGISLITAVDKVKECEVLVPEDVTDSVWAFPALDPVSKAEFVGSPSSARSTPQHILDLALHTTFMRLVAQSVQTVLEDLGATLGLASVRLGPSCVPTSSSDVAQHRESFFDTASVADGALASSRVFAPSQKRPWPSEGLFDLLVELSLSVPEQSFEASVSPLCMPCSAAAKCTHKELFSVCGFFKDFSQLVFSFAYVTQTFLKVEKLRVLGPPLETGGGRIFGLREHIAADLVRKIASG